MNKYLFILSIIVLFTLGCSHSVINTTTNQVNQKKTSRMGTIIPIKLNEQVKIDESLSVKLIDFSHKRPMIGGPTKATAYIVLLSNGETVERSLSKHGIQDQPEIVEYDSIDWEKYVIELNNLKYNHSIEIIITSNNHK